MFSFSSLAVFSTIAFGALTSALPLSTGLPVDLPVDPSAVTGVVSGLPVDPSAVTGVVSGLPVVGGIVGGIAGRTDAKQSIAVILTGVTTQLGPVTQTLSTFAMFLNTIRC